MARRFGHRVALLLAATALQMASPPASAQDEGMGEVIVTAMRRESDDFDERIPAVGLKRTADFAVVKVTVMGDTREATAAGVKSTT